MNNAQLVFPKVLKQIICILLLTFFSVSFTHAQTCATKITFTDTVSWANAKKGVIFKADPIPYASYWQWSFGDPASAVLNTAPFAWNTYHLFVGGPGIYNVRFTAQIPNCKDFDTCFKLYVYGPMAQINIPGEENRNNFIPARLMPITEFTKANASNGCATPDSVVYSIFTNKTTKNYKVYKYCNASAVNGSTLYDTIEACGNKEYKLRSIKYQPTDSSIITRTDSTEVIKVFRKGNTVPAIAYYPSTGKPNVLRTEPDGLLRYDKPINMHDSDLYTCKPNNLVKFTNQSIKYRLADAADNKYPYLSPDTCKHKNYPYASDSMSYLWKFNDPYAISCTSTVNNPDVNCNFSTEVAPYHLFKSNDKGCHEVTLEVTDTWTDKNGKQRTSTDIATIMLRSGAPDAGWDENLFSTMNYDIQQQSWSKSKLGFIMNGWAKCAGAGFGYNFGFNFSGTIPSCGPEDYWLVFDSAAAVKTVCTANGKIKYDYGFLGAENKKGYPIGGPKSQWTGLPWHNRYWYMSGDTGYKTIGVVLKNGDCYDTAWYHNYFRLNSGFAEFCIYDAKTNNKLGCSENYITKLNPDSLGHKPKHINVIPRDRNIKDYDGGITYQLRRSEFPANDPYYYQSNLPAEASLDPVLPVVTDSVTRDNYKLGKDTLQLQLPYPGFYQLWSRSKNSECQENSQLQIINGHYARFWASDSIIYVGDTVQFNQKTRYWTTICAPPMGGVPPYGCLDEKLNVWESDPVARRKALGWDPTKNSSFVAEKLPVWDYGDGTTSNTSVPGNTDKTRPYHIYTKPGVYTVTMTTQDSNNYQVATVRRKFIKVIELQPGFRVSSSQDTTSLCSMLPQLTDTSKIVLGPESTGKYARYVEQVKKRFPPKPPYHMTDYDSIVTDTIIVDSLVASVWEIGNSSFTTMPGQSFIAPVSGKGSFDVSLTLKSLYKQKTLTKTGAINLNGNSPSFEIMDSIGCTPFTVRVKMKRNNAPVFSYLWNKGDGTSQTANSNDTLVNLVYNTPGNYNLAVTILDTVYNNGIYDTCKISFPVSNNIQVGKDCVWPGDANADKKVDNKDILAIGIAYADTGAARTDTSTTWTAKIVQDWSKSFLSGANYKHADSDGNGIINSTDTAAITRNYSKTHAKKQKTNRGKNTDPVLKIDIQNDSLKAGDTLVAYIILGENALPANDVYGIAFSLQYNNKYLDAASVDYAGNWFGNNIIGYSNRTNGLDMALTRTDKKNISGNGRLATIKMLVKESEELDVEQLKLEIVDNILISANEHELPVNVVDDSVRTYKQINNINSRLRISSNEINVYPNPFKEQIFIEYTLKQAGKTKIILYDINGRTQMLLPSTMQQTGKHHFVLNANDYNIPSGVYLVFIEVDGTPAYKRIVKVD